MNAPATALSLRQQVSGGAVIRSCVILVLKGMLGKIGSGFIETAVKFEDGRAGKISATLTIVDAKIFPPMRSAA